MILDIYFLLLTMMFIIFSMPLLSTKRYMAKERRIREELKMVENLGFDSYPQ
jgi:hypothetical protein